MDPLETMAPVLLAPAPCYTPFSGHFHRVWRFLYGPFELKNCVVKCRGGSRDILTSSALALELAELEQELELPRTVLWRNFRSVSR